MKKGISVWAFQPTRPLPEVFAMAKAAGFDAVEVAIADDGPINFAIDEAGCQEVVAQAAHAGVELVALASGFGWSHPITAEDQALREAGTARAAHSLRVAKWLGLDTILLVPGGVGADFIPGFPVTPYDIAYKNVTDSLLTLATHAAETGVTVGVENVWNKFLLSPLEMRNLLDAVGNPYVKSYFDVGNVLLTGYPEQWIPILGSRIQRVHFKDFKTAVGNLSGFCPLLEGDVNWPAVMAAFREIGYDGYVTAEFFDVEGDLESMSKAMDEILKL